MSAAMLICGGGTGGHVFPGLAMADALVELADVKVTFAGSPRGLESRVVPARGYALELLDVEPMKGGGPARAARGAVVAARAIGHAIRLVRKVSPKAILSVGGYAAGPVALAGAGLGIPVAILEPNSTLGLANRLMSPFAKRAYLAWDETAAKFKAGRARIFGVPLRAGFSPRSYEPKGSARVLVMGGSQGALPLNDRLPAAIARIAPDVSGLDVVHQAGKGRDASVRESYERVGFKGVRVVPFLDDVADEIARADVIVARAGAVTVAEIASIGRASILIPFPHAADDHQAKNAMALASLGGAVCVRQEAADDTRISLELSRLLEDPALRTSIADGARRHGRPDAARDIAKDLLGLAEIEPLPKARVTNGSSSANGFHKEAR